MGGARPIAPAGTKNVSGVRPDKTTNDLNKLEQELEKTRLGSRKVAYQCIRIPCWQYIGVNNYLFSYSFKFYGKPNIWNRSFVFVIFSSTGVEYCCSVDTLIAQRSHRRFSLVSDSELLLTHDKRLLPPM